MSRVQETVSGLRFSRSVPANQQQAELAEPSPMVLWDQPASQWPKTCLEMATRAGKISQ